MAERAAPARRVVPGRRSPGAAPDRHAHAAADQPRRRRNRSAGLLRARLRRGLLDGDQQLHLRDGQAAQPAVQRAHPAQLLEERGGPPVDELENDIARECLLLHGDRAADLHLDRRRPSRLDGPRQLERFRRRAAERAARLPWRARDRRPARRGGLAHRDRRLGQPIGKQDQYAAAFGGLNFFVFKPGGAVTVEPQRIAGRALRQLFDSMLLFWTGHQRDAGRGPRRSSRRTPTPSWTRCSRCERTPTGCRSCSIETATVGHGRRSGASSTRPGSSSAGWPARSRTDQIDTLVPAGLRGRRDRAASCAGRAAVAASCSSCRRSARTSVREALSDLIEVRRRTTKCTAPR